MQRWDEGIYWEPGAGPRDARPLILSCGVHGDEQAPVVVGEALLADLQRRSIRLRRPCLLVFANPLAIEENRRFHRQDLNRLFGLAQRPATLEGERAGALEAACREFIELHGPGWHLDLHATIKPSLHPWFALQPHGQRPYDPRWPAVLAAAGFSARVQQRSPAPTFAHFTASALACDSFTLECGDIGDPGADTTARLAHFVRQLLTVDALPAGTARLAEFEVAMELIRHSADFHFHVDERSANFAPLPAGTLIATEGTTRVTAPAVPCALLFANAQVPLGQRAGLVVVPAAATV